MFSRRNTPLRGTLQGDFLRKGAAGHSARDGSCRVLRGFHHAILQPRVDAVEHFLNIRHLLNQHRAFPDQLIAALAAGAGRVAGNPITSRFCSSAVPTVMSEPLLTPASTTMTPDDSPLMMRLRMGK